MSLNSPNALRYKFSSPKTTTKKRRKKGSCILNGGRQQSNFTIRNTGSRRKDENLLLMYAHICVGSLKENMVVKG